MRVGVIGPTNISMLAQFLGRSQEVLAERAALVGQILAEAGVELWVVADGGMLYVIAQSYKKHGGVKLVMLLPSEQSTDWPIEHARPYVGMADKVRRPSSWVRANREVVSFPEICLCVGLSSGTSSEFAYIRWDLRLPQTQTHNPLKKIWNAFRAFLRGRSLLEWRALPRNLRVLIAIREFLRGSRIPPEHSYVLAPILRYLDKVEELRAVLEGDSEGSPTP